MATKVASLFAVLDLKDNLTGGLDKAKDSLGGFGANISSIGGSLQGLGANISVMMAPVALALGGAVSSAVEFEKAMKNAQSVTGVTADEAARISEEVLKLGGASLAGPQKVAEAYYDIVSGVSDASTHIAILKAAILTSEAGASELKGTTAALIGVMNSYGMKASEAAHASDVLTQMVRKGVGTMDQFGAALPEITGLASSLGVKLEEAAGAAAYLTTKGFSASQAATQLKAMMMALANPNEDMKKGLKELGFETGQQALQTLGLVGTYQRLSTTTTANTVGLAKMTGSSEALQGALALTGTNADRANQFMGEFKTGINGATEAARKVQMTSTAAQFDLLKSSVQELGIRVGNVLLPKINALITEIKPLVEQIIDWVQKNPELVDQILKIALGAIVLGPALVVLGTVISAIGTVVSAAATAFGVLTGAVAFLLSPVGILLVALLALGVAVEAAYPGGLGGAWKDAGTSLQMLAGIILGSVLLALRGLKDMIDQAWRSVQMLAGIFMGALTIASLWVQNNVVQPLITKFQEFVTFIQGLWASVETAVQTFALNIQEGLLWVDENVLQPLKTAFETAMKFINDIWNLVAPGIEIFKSSMETAFNWVKTNVIDPIVKAIEAIGKALGEITGQTALAEQRAANAAWAASPDRMMAPNPYTFDNPPGKAGGGDVYAGQTYKVGERGVELFTPTRNGVITPNHEIGKGSGPLIGSVAIYANSRAEGAAAADGFEKRLKQIKMARGLT